MSAAQRRDIPCLEHPIVETHCHLDYLPPESLETALAEARRVGVTSIVTIAVSPDNLATVREIAATHHDVWCTQGIHPHEAAGWNASVADGIREAAGDTGVVAVGEIGLDYYYDHADRQQQRTAFAEQLALAAELDLPVVIHSRDADDDMQAMLREQLGQLPRRGVIHSFSSGMALAEFCLAEGFHLGYNGMVTFRNADNVREAAAATPLDQLVLETDAPYLTPVPYRGHPNAPKYLPFIAEKLADLHGIAVEQLLHQVEANSRRLFPRLGAPL